MADIKLGAYGASLAVLARHVMRRDSLIETGGAEGSCFAQHYVVMPRRHQ